MNLAISPDLSNRSYIADSFTETRVNFPFKNLAVTKIYKKILCYSIYYQSGTLLIGGMSIFCGTIYYHALTEEKGLRKFTPYGGVLLILGWLSMVL